MYFWGIVSFWQITFLPGFIICRLFKIKGLTKVIIYSFALSHIINYAIVFALTALGFYIRPVMVAIVVAEILWLCYLVRNEKASYVLVTFAKQKKVLQCFFKTFQRDLIINALFILCVFAVLFFITSFINNKRDIFTYSDAVSSWNHYAKQWSFNRLPVHTAYYGQLIPANWSLSYVLMGNNNPVEFFAKSTMPLFSLYVFLYLFQDAIRKTSVHSLFASLTWFFLVYYTWGKGQGTAAAGLTTGIVDIPVAFFSFLGVYLLWQLTLSPAKRNFWTQISLAYLFYSAAIATKLSAVFILPIIVFLTFVLIRQRKIQLSTHVLKSSIRNQISILLFFCFLLFLLSWYGYTQFTILFNLGNASNLEKLTQASKFHDYPISLNRIIDSISLLNESLFPFLGFIILFVFFGSLTKKGISLTVFYLFPAFICWSLLLSYDLRSFTVAFPAISLLCGLGFEFSRERILKSKLRPFLHKSISNFYFWHILIIAVFINFLRTLPYSDTELLKQEDQKRIPYKETSIHQFLHQLYKKEPAYIISNYNLLKSFYFTRNYYIPFTQVEQGQIQSIIKDKNIKYIFCYASAYYLKNNIGNYDQCLSLIKKIPHSKIFFKEKSDSQSSFSFVRVNRLIYQYDLPPSINVDRPLY